ncbi:MAG TPA: TonB-dependent receptor [Bryobacteraceae bacterium]|nr:TonB-dependent receptor [Bryobacteraceae bacterium]
MKHESTLRTLFAFVVVLFAAAMLFQVSGFAQATDSTIVGVVTDSTGSGIPGAAITALNKQTGVKYTTVTNNSGEYRLNDVPLGNYDVSATSSGFATATVTGAELQLNRTATVNLTLAVGTVSTSVEVTGAAAAIDTSTAQLQSTFGAKQAVDLPIAGKSAVAGGAGIYNLSLLGAGVASSGGVGQGVGPSVSGQRPDANSFNLDGVANDDHYDPAPQIYVSNEAISQFTLLQNQFGAEFGGAAGGIFNAVVKTGTNSVHGSIYDYNQNRMYNAIDQQTLRAGNTTNPRFDLNRLGATVGGPIIKDRLFYFGNYEYTPLGQAGVPGQLICAPTSAGISALNSLPTGSGNVNKTNLGVFEKYVPVAGSPDVADCGTTSVLGQNIPIGALSFASPSYFNSYDAVVAIDYNISQSDQLRGRFIYANTTGIDNTPQLPVFFLPIPAVGHTGSISEFHNFSPTMENELRIAFSRQNASEGSGPFTFPGLNAFPNLSFDDLGLDVGPSGPSGDIENKFQVQENLTKTWGRHTFKVGYDLVDIILTGYFVQRSRGDYDYTGIEQYLLDMSPTGGAVTGVAGERSVGSAAVPFGFLEHAAYFQDDFRLRPNLTFNLGVRYEYVTVPVGSRYQVASAPANVPGVISFGIPKARPNDWSPRIGFNYSPGKDGLWSIRGGFARSFYNTYINLNQNASPPYFQTTLDVNSNVSSPNFLASGGLVPALVNGTPTPAQARAAAASYTFDQDRPYALTATLGVQRSLGKDYTVEARYVYTKGVHLYNQTRLNIVTPITPTQSIPTFTSAPSASTLASLPYTLGYLQSLPHNTLAQDGFPNNLVGYHPWGNSRYSGLQVQLNKRYSANLSIIAAYTWSHAQDDATATNFSTILSPRRAQDFQNLAAEWGSSALDRRQRFTFTPVYDFRPFQNGNWLLKNVVGNWNVSGTYTYQSPEFATVQSGVDSNLNGDTAGDRTVINPNGAATVGSGIVGYTATGQMVTAGSSCSSGACKGIVAYVATNPNARYIEAGLGAYANGGRNTLPLGHINNFDLALTKRFSRGERFRLDLSAQASNLFNHTQFVGGYISDVASFSTSATSRAFLEPQSSSFNNYGGFFPSNSRTLQLVGRFNF